MWIEIIESWLGLQEKNPEIKSSIFLYSAAFALHIVSWSVKNELNDYKPINKFQKGGLIKQS